jgi:hypothetical protein
MKSMRRREVIEVPENPTELDLKVAVAQIIKTQFSLGVITDIPRLVVTPDSISGVFVGDSVQFEFEINEDDVLSFKPINPDDVDG